MKKALLLVALTATTVRSLAQTDTLRVMTYNVLYYGNGCQGPTEKYHGYLKTIIGYTSPDIVTLEKMASIPVTPDDKAGTAPYGFADSVLQYAFNAAYPGRYAYCPFTNASHANNIGLLVYDTRKLGFVSIVSSYANITDFNTYKLYYKDPALARTHDTTFLYLTLNHDKSGKENEEVRGRQIAEKMEQLKAHFTSLPNMLNIGDFNLRSSEEPVYQQIVFNKDENFRFYDAPFNPDNKLKYPANWGHDANYSGYFTTSTRQFENVPNACGSGGGAKGWYDHIFMSDWIVKGTNYIKYVPNSYRTIGNDGQRTGVSINNSNGHVNTSAPAEVIEALYQFSNKYPVMIQLAVTSNTTGKSPKDPEIGGVAVAIKVEAKVDNPVKDELVLHFPDAMKGQELTITCTDKNGTEQMKKQLTVRHNDEKMKCKLAPGTYTLRINSKHSTMQEMQITKE